MTVPGGTPVLAGPGQPPVAGAGDVVEGAEELDVVPSFWVDTPALGGEAAEAGGVTASCADEPDVRPAIAVIVATTANTRTATIASAASETWKRARVGLGRCERIGLLY
jgi:hypothetical protein